MSIRICGPNCTTEQKNSNNGCGDSQVSYEGAVLETYERNGSWDSDFYAIVWDEAEGRVRTIEYASTRGWTYHNGANVDATPEVEAKARLSLTPAVYKAALAKADADASQIRKGDEVRSTTTRGAKKGLVGIVRSIVPSRYGKGMCARVEVIGQPNLVWMSLDRCERVTPDPVDVNRVLLSAQHFVKTQNFRSLLFVG